MNQNKSQFWKGKGFYLALTLVIAGAALASFLAIDSMMTRLSANSTSTAPIDGEETIPWNEEHTTAQAEKQGVPEKTDSSASSKTPAPSSAASSGPASQQQPASSAPASSASEQQPAQPTSSYVSPMTGQFLQGYSADELVYNETLEDWRTHNGVDLTGLNHENVMSPMDATVMFAAEDDPLWGGVVELQAADGTLVRLCGLDSVYVRQGQQVQQGKAVGLLGQVPCEAALAQHLHIECEREGAYIDPAELLGIDTSNAAVSSGASSASSQASEEGTDASQSATESADSGVGTVVLEPDVMTVLEPEDLTTPLPAA